MTPDDELCLCFHVSWRKVINYARIHQVRLPSQLSQCGGAGTGCGWCRASMQRIVECVRNRAPLADEIDRWLAEEFPKSAEYRKLRAQYIQDGKKENSADQSSDA